MKIKTTAAAVAAAVILLTGCGSAASSSGESSAAETAKAGTSAADLSGSSAEPEEESSSPEPEEKDMESLQEHITELPPEGYDQDREGVTYPEFQKLVYYSQTAERKTKVNVLLPAGYDESRKYPVLYILHGFYDTEDWMARKKVALSRILTNLQLDGKAKEGSASFRIASTRGMSSS